MAIVRVQSVGGQGINPTISVTLPAAPTAGNTLIAFNNTNVAAPTSTPSGSGWVQVHQRVYAASARWNTCWRKTVQAGDSATISQTNAGASLQDLHVYEYSGLAAVPEDKTADAISGGTTTLSTGTTATTDQADELLMAAFAFSGNPNNVATYTNSFTEREESTRMSTADRIVSATGTYETTATWTTNRSVGAMLVTFKAAVSGPTIHDGGAALAGAGNPGVTPNAIYSTGAAVSGSAALGASSGLRLTSGGSVAGDGAVAANAALRLASGSALSGLGVVSAGSVGRRTPGGGSAAGTGSLSGADMGLTMAGGANLLGEGDLILVLEVFVTGGAALGGNGGLSVYGRKLYRSHHTYRKHRPYRTELIHLRLGGQSALGGAGQIVASGQLLMTLAANLLGAGDTTVNPGLLMTIGGALTGEGTTQAGTVRLIMNGAASLVGVGFLKGPFYGVDGGADLTGAAALALANAVRVVVSNENLLVGHGGLRVDEQFGLRSGMRDVEKVRIDG